MCFEKVILLSSLSDCDFVLTPCGVTLFICSVKTFSRVNQIVDVCR